MANRYEGLFEDWEIGIAKKIIHEFRKQWACLDREEFDDLLQECLIRWHFSKDDYSAKAGANRRTFMARVIKGKLLDLVDALTSDKRKISSTSESLDECVSDEEDSPTYLDQLVDDSIPNLQFSAELKIDISNAFKKLNPHQQDLYRLLSEEGLSIKEASQVLGTPRGTLYEDIKRIKAIFQKESLHEYLD